MTDLRRSFPRPPQASAAGRHPRGEPSRGRRGARGRRGRPELRLPRLAALGLGLALLLAPPSPAHAGDGARFGGARLRGVAHELRIELQLPRRPAFEPEIELLPGDRILEALLPTTAEDVEIALRRLPTEMEAQVDPILGGVRLRIMAPAQPLRWAQHRRGGELLLLLGPEAESERLRSLAAALRQPLPEPGELGAQLELWQEAERATRDADLELAQKLWEKLAEEPELRDLARLRAAELFVISGHIEEAQHRLRVVARDHPRSSGAALARISSLHLDALTGEGDPTAAEVVVAATSGGRSSFHAFTWLRAAAALEELDRCDLGLAHLPDPAQLPGRWRDALLARRHELVACAVGRAAARGDHLELATQYEAWSLAVAAHPRREIIDSMAAETYGALGLAEAALPLIRAQLARESAGPREALKVDALARNYHRIGDLPHQRAVVAYLVRKHPESPGVASRVRELILAERRASGFAAAWGLTSELAAAARTVALRRSIAATQIDLARAWGDAEQLVRAIEGMRDIGYDAPSRREVELAMALARAGRHIDAEAKLRAWIARTTDPELRDELAYLLAEADLALGRRTDADAVLRAIATHETRWGRLARARQRELGLARIVTALERRNGETPPPKGNLP